MKITDIKTYIVSPIPGSPWVFVEVETDEGITGLGECTDYRSGPMLVAGIEAVKAIVVGEDPAHIEEIWQRIFRQYSSLSGRGFISHLISGIDIALWDIRGQVLGQPIYKLLGGAVRDRIPLYTHIQDQWYDGVTIDDAVVAAKQTLADGHDAIKTDPFKWQRKHTGEFTGADRVEYLSPRALGEAVDWMDAVREAVGPETELMVDAHGRFDVASAIAGGRALEHINLIWYEEPVPPESFKALRQVRESTDIPICMGERHFTRYDYVPMLEERLVDFIMPDISWTGGISEMMRIASLAEPFYVRISPHDALGPVSIMAGFHCSMTIPNFYRLECLHTRFPDFARIMDPMFEYDGKWINPTDRPGLGVALNHETLDEFLVDPTSEKARAFR
ncbi:MAG TPA: mandelate racemase/muconate lactonizing enzyme family protein [Dehalococcoidia bacterium]|jgi:galactonate dehydratase|nr:mandelate racemase [Chloroflexota bacterium]MDP5877763.1 mandelate racemase/muconate lactonizing enzyme family protein [Dehalococcoidia bacterium]MDP7161470.1 mandelate racemase/muconate lactonizing enzyme family protein [Dehalococcoidia bacterium]MDP7212191.1 mandelate racemase/muconate lactonizing enzyme family protein [Dehalococcoidia bacterium]MDP7515361.1 mandelate racemase/muconate lactonizing enzyme family protein [Dehalococcoidia bacterium]|tara:strand:- start:3237 stop:4406 length:1170 start_codon:yes stop_codon:yes gene_type:complete